MVEDGDIYMSMPKLLYCIKAYDRKKVENITFFIFFIKMPKGIDKSFKKQISAIILKF